MSETEAHSRGKNAAWWLPITWAVVLFILSSLPGHTYPKQPFWSADKLVHAVVYGILAVLCLRAVRSGWNMRGASAVIVASTMAALYGMTDEIHQMFVPGRSADWRDVIADGAGAFLGATMWNLFAPGSRR